MAPRIDCTVVVRDGIDGVGLSQSAATQVGVADGDAIAVRRTDGTRTTATVRIDGSLTGERLAVGRASLERFGVSDGETVSVQRVEPEPAEQVTVAPVTRLAIRGGDRLVRDAVGTHPVSEGDTVTASLFDGSLDIPLRVLSTRPPGPVVLTEATTVEVTDGPAPVGSMGGLDPLPASAVGGYDETVEALGSALSGPLSGGSAESSAGRAGVLVTGPHGVGKTHLLCHAAWRLDAALHSVDVGRLLAVSYDAAEDHLNSVTRTARGAGRSVVHLDALDTIAEEGTTSVRLLLRDWLDGIAATDGVVVAAEATEESAVPVTYVQGNRLSRTVAVSEPNRSDRADILAAVAGDTPTGPGVDLTETGEQAFGYVAADLVALWSHAVDTATARDGSREVVVRADDLAEATAAVGPSGMRGSVPEVPSTSFDDIGGLAAAKRELIRAVDWPLTNPELFDALEIDPPAGVLLYGPPGTGKTMLARAVASTSGANFLPVDGPELMNKYVGESERAVRRVFDRARSNAPAILFFDEIDALGATRDDDSDSPATARTVSQLLTELDGIEGRGGITVIATTNRPDRLDEALLRTGRFDRIVEVPMPDADARREIFAAHLGDRVHDSVDLRALAERTEGYTGSDIAAVVREAGLLAIGEHLRDGSKSSRTPKLRARHVSEALSAVEPSLSERSRREYESFDRFD
ncbi:AAA family ATPase [Haloarcula halophila]|uniref:AAA family ATPase n=1 Tax=Haloarcula TaxID=2237 RepID=UPI0023E3F16C|nr:AAA family ATPase [Halomicroarcula sp. DFY41]